MANKFKGCPYPDCDNCPYYDCKAPQSYINKIDKEMGGANEIQKKIEKSISLKVGDCEICPSRVKLLPAQSNGKFKIFCAERFRELKPNWKHPPSWCPRRRNRNL